MIVIPGRIPIAIHPFFWVLAAFIGWMNSRSLLLTLIWMGIIFVSVLVHEYGHALTSIMFRQKPRIQLVALGGLTSYEGPKLKFWQQFIIVFNGPLFGFFLFIVATICLQADLSRFPLLYFSLKVTQVANLFWSVVNLLPVLPLDGGQLLRIVLEGIFGLKGFRASLLVGAVVSVLFSFYFFMVQEFLAGALFFLFAFQSFDSWRKMSKANVEDREEDNKQLLTQGELALRAGKKEEAKIVFYQVCEKAKGGILSATAAQYLAVLLMQEGKRKEAYDLLLPIQQHLADDTRCLLHQLAEEYQNDVIVAELSKECYQFLPSPEMALRSARAFARLKKPKMAGGWLMTAVQYGGLNLEAILQEEPFMALKGNSEFEEFVKKLR